MAETKKKSTAKKSSPKKTSASAASKKAATKKAPVASSKKSSTKKAAPKKVEKKATPVSKTAKENNNTWAVVAILLAAVVIILTVVVGALYFAQSNGPETESENETPVVVEGAVKLLIVEDPTCASCQVDLFVNQVKDNLIPDLEVEKISIETDEAKAIVEGLDLNQVPVYLFSTNIDERDDWAANLAGAFVKVNVEEAEYYLLNPQFIPSKVLIEEPVVTENALVIGDANAPVTVIEFSDFECPFCAIAEGNDELVTQFKAQNPAYVPPMPKIIEEYVESGQVKVVFYNFPIAGLHPQARIVHNAVLCANEQDAYKDYSRMIWDDRAEWSAASDRASVLKGYAAELELDETQFAECLDNVKYDAQIDEEMALGQSYGVSGTPAFFVGKTFISGAQDYTVFKELIDAQLNE